MKGKKKQERERERAFNTCKGKATLLQLHPSSGLFVGRALLSPAAERIREVPWCCALAESTLLVHSGASTAPEAVSSPLCCRCVVQNRGLNVSANSTAARETFIFVDFIYIVIIYIYIFYSFQLANILWLSRVLFSSPDQNNNNNNKATEKKKGKKKREASRRHRSKVDATYGRVACITAPPAGEGACPLAQCNSHDVRDSRVEERDLSPAIMNHQVKLKSN